MNMRLLSFTLLAQTLTLASVVYGVGTFDCLTPCKDLQDGHGDSGLDLNPPNPGFDFDYFIVAYPHGACDYVGSVEAVTGTVNPDPLFSLVNKEQPNCPPIFDPLSPFDANGNVGSLVGGCTGYTCIFPSGNCTWNQRGDLIFETKAQVCPKLAGPTCDLTKNC
ncbi:hypothetical protein C8Q75DRAFT_165213 [Abortiporus biennis]|nr:hypothetical protein C8Q75DRAFT_165213 [Abortiporus biennis]